MGNLPNELVGQILSLCDPITVITCRAVCKSMCKLIAESTCLQYHIELFADGMMETCLPCPYSSAERLSLLRSRRAAWRELRWSQRPAPMISGYWSAYELVDGIFSKTLSLVENNNARGIVFTVLPSKDDPGSLTRIDNVGFAFRDFAMDPAQDLIVFLQCNRVSPGRMHVTLHFRTISNNKIHPRALEPSMSVTLFSIEIIGAVIQTANDVVGLMIWDHDFSQLYIWDWTQCIPLVSQPHLHRLDAFAFISDRAYVLTSPSPRACFHVYTINANPEGLTTPLLCATLHLPQMHNDARTSQFGIHTGPFVTISQDPHAGFSKPFVQDSRRRIHVVSLELWIAVEPIRAPTSCLIVVHNNTFLRFNAGNTDINFDTTPVDLEWLAWGPDHTYWLPGRTGSSWLRYVHGERLVRLHSLTEHGPRDLEVYDFGAPRGPSSWYDPSEYTTSILNSPVFTQLVVGRLPCRVVRKSGNFPYSGFMIDEERLIGLKHDLDPDQAESVDVFVF